MLARMKVPPFLKRLYALWMRLAHAMGWVNTRVLLFLFYFLVMGPFALVARLFGKNFFEDHAKGASSYWHERPAPGFTKESCRQQF